MYVFNNSFAINLSGTNMYNQVSGKTLNAYFKDGAIDYTRTKGSPAQSVYYAKDENDAMVGVNNASGSIIDMRFENKELKMKFSHHPDMYAKLESLGGNRFYVTYSDPIFSKAIFPFKVEARKVTGVHQIQSSLLPLSPINQCSLFLNNTLKVVSEP